MWTRTKAAVILRPLLVLRGFETLGGGAGGHLGVGIIAVGGQEDLGHLLEAPEEDGQIGLWGAHRWFQNGL